MMIEYFLSVMKNFSYMPGQCPYILFLSKTLFTQCLNSPSRCIKKVLAICKRNFPLAGIPVLVDTFLHQASLSFKLNL